MAKWKRKRSSSGKYYQIRTGRYASTGRKWKMVRFRRGGKTVVKQYVIKNPGKRKGKRGKVLKVKDQYGRTIRITGHAYDEEMKRRRARAYWG